MFKKSRLVSIYGVIISVLLTIGCLVPAVAARAEGETVTVTKSNFSTYFDDEGNLKPGEFTGLKFSGDFKDLAVSKIVINRAVEITSDNASFDGVYVEITAKGVSVDGLSIKNSSYGIIVNDSEDVVLTNNTINVTTDTTHDGYAVEAINAGGLKMSSNSITFVGNSTGDAYNKGLYIHGTLSSDITVSENIFDITTPSAPTIWVEKPAGSGNWVGDYMSMGIQIEDEGTTSSTITFSDNNVTASYNNVYGAYDTLCTVSIKKTKGAVTVSNNKIVANGHSYTYGLSVGSESITIDKNDITTISDNVCASGIELSSGSSYCVIRSNTLKTEAVNQVYGIYSGWNTYTGNGARVIDNDISVKATNCIGINLYSYSSPSQGFYIGSNTIVGEGAYLAGMAVRVDGKCDIKDNTIEMSEIKSDESPAYSSFDINDVRGIYIDSSAEAEISGNSVQSSNRGIIAYCASSITNNTVISEGDYAIDVDDSALKNTKATVTENKISAKSVNGDASVKYSDADDVHDNHNLTYVLTIKSYDGTKILDTIPAIFQYDKYFAYLDVTKYLDYLFFTKANGRIGDQFGPTIQLKDSHTIGRMFFILTEDLTLYAVEPIYKDKVLKIDLSDGNNVEISVKNYNDLRAAYNNYDRDDSNEYLTAFYFQMLIYQKWKSGEFGDITELSSEELNKKMFDTTYYVTPYSSFDKLTEGDKAIADKYFGESRVLPHLSLEEEEGTVMKINVRIDTDTEGKNYTTMIFSSIDSDKKVEDALIMDIGRYPTELNHGIAYYFGGDSEENVIISSSKLYITYGSDKPSPTPSATPEVEPSPASTVSPTPSVSPTPTQTPGADDDITKEIPFAENVPVEEKSVVIEKTNTDKKDVEGSTHQYLYPKAAKVTKNSIKITWKKVKGADGYIIYGNTCGKKMKYITTIKKASATSYTAKKLKKGKYYKYLVVAYKTTASGDKVITTSKSVHAATTGGKVGNPTSIKVKKTKVSLKKGKTAKIKASFKKKKKVKTHIAKFRYESLDESIATVSSSGKIKAVSKGTTKIIVYTQNGLSKTIKVTVK